MSRSSEVKGVDIRPMSKAAIDEFYGEMKLDRTVKGYAFYQDGEIKGLAGLERTPRGYFLFSDIKEDDNINKQTIWRCTKFVLQMLEDVVMPVFAYSDKNNKRAHKFCEACGFEKYAEDDDMVYFYRRVE